LRPTTAEGSPFAFDHWTAVAELPNTLRITTADGIERWLGCSYSQGLPGDSLVVTARDITRAREVEQLKDDFVGVVSHELRTPLTSIRGFTEMLLDSDMPLTAQQQIDALATIRRGVQRLDRLIVNLLEVSRVTADYADDRTTPVGLQAVCERMIDEHRASNPHRIIVVTGD